MSTTALATNSLEAYANKAFMTVSGQAVINNRTIANFVKFVGDWIQSEIKEGRAVNTQQLKDASLSIIQARLGIQTETEQQALRESFNTEIDKLLTAQIHSNTSIGLDSLRFDGQYTFTQVIANVLKAIPEGNLNKTTPNDEQKALEEMFVQQAVATALKHAQTEEGVSASTFSQKLSEIIQANPQALSQNTVNKIAQDLNESAYTAYGFYAFSQSPELKEFASKLEQGDITQVTAEEKQAVTEILFTLLSNSTQEGFDIQTELSKTTLSDGQLHYLKHLADKYDQTNQGNIAGDLAAMVTKALPGMAVPALIGAGLGFIFGGSSFLGMFGAIVLSFLGGLDGKDESGNSRKLIQPPAPNPSPSARPEQAEAPAPATA